VALLEPLPEIFVKWLQRVQNDLLDVGADLSVPPPEGETGEQARARLRVTPEYTAWLEAACDEVNDKLPPLRSFVIPGGTPAAAHLHVCRTVCRRAERRTIAVGEEVNPEAVRYLNRLSDLLFILSRAANSAGGARGSAEPLWDPGAHGTGAGGS
jgi:cob(I)alamin adenosyltransferase